LMWEDTDDFVQIRDLRVAEVVSDHLCQSLKASYNLVVGQTIDLILKCKPDRGDLAWQPLDQCATCASSQLESGSGKSCVIWEPFTNRDGLLARQAL